MPTPNMRNPHTAANSVRAQKKSTATKFTRIAQEFLSMILAALIFASVMWSAVWGMSGGFAPTNEAIGMMAGVGDHE